MRCEELQPQLPAYLLGELSGAEAADVERHLAGCRSCAAELDEYRQVAALLGSAGIEARPPAGLKEATFARLQNEDVGVLLGPAAAATPPPDLKQRALSRALTVAPSPAEAKKRSSRQTWLAAAAAIVGIAVAAGSQLRVQDLDQRLSTMQTSVQQAERSFGPVGHPLQQVQLAGTDADAALELVHFRHDNYRVTVKVDDIAVTPPGHHYELWLSGSDGEVSVGSFRIKRPDDLTLNFTAGVDPGKFPQVLITLEETDGDPEMTGNLVARARLDRDAVHHGTYDE